MKLEKEIQREQKREEKRRKSEQMKILGRDKSRPKLSFALKNTWIIPSDVLQKGVGIQCGGHVSVEGGAELPGHEDSWVPGPAPAAAAAGHPQLGSHLQRAGWRGQAIFRKHSPVEYRYSEVSKFSEKMLGVLCNIGVQTDSKTLLSK
jgi:hypothetical protein